MSYQDFDLEKALAKPERVICANGVKPEWHYFENGKAIGFTIIGGDTKFWADTKGYVYPSIRNQYDLKLLPETREVWYNLYRDKSNDRIRAGTCETYPTKDAAEQAIIKGSGTTLDYLGTFSQVVTIP